MDITWVFVLAMGCEGGFFLCFVMFFFFFFPRTVHFKMIQALGKLAVVHISKPHSGEARYLDCLFRTFHILKATEERKQNDKEKKTFKKCV